MAPLVETLTARLTEERGVVAAYLFGSQARGTAGPGSDVDVAVLFGRPPAATFSKVASGPRSRLARGHMPLAIHGSSQVSSALARVDLLEIDVREARTVEPTLQLAIHDPT